jgi:hypothetical protein
MIDYGGISNSLCLGAKVFVGLKNGSKFVSIWCHLSEMVFYIIIDRFLAMDWHIQKFQKSLIT